MARKRSTESDAGQADLVEQFEASLTGLSPDQRSGLLPQLLAAAQGNPFERPTPPSKRRPRRMDVTTYQVRVDLEGTKPPVWRRLELSSDLFLNEVHDILQIAFGWTDSHLHEFASGEDYYDRLAEHYLGPFQVEDGGTGVPETDVRLDEVLAKAGDRLWYQYDFGDSWMHVIKLEAERPQAEGTPRAVCIDGRRDGPSEDCGGVYAFELIAAALDPSHPEHADSITDYANLFGEEVDPEDSAHVPFDLDQINEGLDAPVAELVGPLGLPGPIGELTDAIRLRPQRELFQQLIEDAKLDAPIVVDVDTAVRMVAPYTWLLDRVGADGIKLTGAGYLPPVHVEAAMTDLGLGAEWIGKGNREVQTMPVLHLRESAQAMGLLRKHRGTLLLTKRARELDPVALWWHLAERMPVASKDACETQAGLLLLATIAAGSADAPDKTIANILTAIGWGGVDGTPMTPSMTHHAAWDTSMVLHRLGAFVDEPRSLGPDKPTSEGVMFARAALRTWPSGS